MLEHNHTMVEKYRSSELDKELIPSLTFRDIVFISVYFSITRLTVSLVVSQLRIPYMLFNLIVGYILTRPLGAANYPKRLYHTIWYKVTKLQQDTMFAAVETDKEVL